MKFLTELPKVSTGGATLAISTIGAAGKATLVSTGVAADSIALRSRRTEKKKAASYMLRRCSDK